MQGGDISNRPAPVVVIDVDDLIIFKNSDIPDFQGPFKKVGLWLKNIGKQIIGKKEEADLGLNYIVNEEIYFLLEKIMWDLGVDIYFFAHRDKTYQEPLENLLSNLPYNKLIVGGIKEREILLQRKNVRWYFYSDPAHTSMLSKGKEIRVNSWKEIDLTK